MSDRNGIERVWKGVSDSYKSLAHKLANRRNSPPEEKVTKVDYIFLIPSVYGTSEVGILNHGADYAIGYVATDESDTFFRLMGVKIEKKRFVSESEPINVPVHSTALDGTDLSSLVEALYSADLEFKVEAKKDKRMEVVSLIIVGASVAGIMTAYMYPAVVVGLLGLVASGVLLTCLPSVSERRKQKENAYLLRHQLRTGVLEYGLDNHDINPRYLIR